MLFIQLTGLSGVGKTTLAYLAKNKLMERGYQVEVIDGDEYRKLLCTDLTFSKKDRIENIRRLGIVSHLLSRNNIISILAAINPYECMRQELINYGKNVKTVWLNCDLEILIERDVKGLYKRAMLPDYDPQKVYNFTGITDPYECPVNADLSIDTGIAPIETNAKIFVDFILSEIENIQRQKV
ncbi:MAG: adenylylsulfate kinase ApsK [Ferruginibacter sp.]|nr:adenylylsulfate kinase ApsK [Ferruginibacter sp.]